MSVIRVTDYTAKDNIQLFFIQSFHDSIATSRLHKT